MSKIEHPYLKLIDILLSNPREQEISILNANQKLVNQEFITCLMSVGEKLRRSGDIDAAERLINLAAKLLQLEKTNTSTNRRREYFQFLMTLLQQVSNQVAPAKIYDLIRDNQDKLDQNATQILNYWANETIMSVDSQQQRAIANDLVNFGNLISAYPAGDKANNIELAIVSYQTALKVYHPTIFPQDWALIQSNLANAWRDRFVGNRQENVEQALATYQLALEVITKAKYPYLWANVQRNLGIAYSYRIQGERSKNLERAIACYKRALSVHTLEDYPQDWAAAHNNLGDIYPNRLVGDQASNIETAINHLEQALEIYTLAENPHRWAMLQNNLGNAFQSRIEGDKSD
ncbi:MAG: tetratricopeptide repeat protein, partial [Waterburya sp.]